MKNKIYTLVICLSGGLLCVTASTLTGQAQTGSTPGKEATKTIPGPVVNTHELMELFNQPVYRSLKQSLASGESIGNWSEIKHDTTRIAEIANLIAIRPTAEQHDDWSELSAAVQTSAIELVDAASNEDQEQATIAFTNIVESCNACHQATKPSEAPTLENLSN